MDIYALLRKDHAYLQELMLLLGKAKTDMQQRRVVAQLRMEFIIHSHAEEEVFYSALEHRDETFSDHIIRSKEEHGRIQAMFKPLLQADTEATRQSLIEELNEMLEKHLDSEEMQVFSVAESNFSEEEAETLASQMKAKKKQLRQQWEQEGHEAA